MNDLKSFTVPWWVSLGLKIIPLPAWAKLLITTVIDLVNGLPKPKQDQAATEIATAFQKSCEQRNPKALGECFVSWQSAYSL